jgi:iron complex outermembrane receptor protein
MNKRARQIVPNLLAASVLLALAGTAAGQSTQAGANPQPPTTSSDQAKQPATLSTVVVTGTRVLGRTLKDSLQPVDVVSGETLRQTGAFDFGTALSRAIPSLNFPMSPASDLEAFQRPFQLRSMPPDEVLVLVDGKRWHPGALVMTLANIGVGSQGYDLNTIPLSAVDHIEVLRDGASAQYGSDAIAGVVNVILKKGAQGGSVTATAGQYAAGDGRTWRGAGNFGVSLGDKGWMRFTLEDGNQDETNRAEPDDRPGLAQYGTLFHTGVVPFKDSNALINGQYDITRNVQFYAYGHFGRREGTPYDFYRYGLNTPYPKSPGSFRTNAASRPTARWSPDCAERSTAGTGTSARTPAATAFPTRRKTPPTSRCWRTSAPARPSSTTASCARSSRPSTSTSPSRWT